MKKAVIFPFLIFFYLGIVHAELEIPIAKKQAIDKLMEATETAKNIRLGLPLVFHEIFQAVKTRHSSLGARDADEIEKTLLELMASRIDGPNGFVARSYPIYDKYFTLEEIEELTNFYSTPVGKKIQRVAPAMSAQEMQLGRQVAIEMLPAVQTKMLELMKDKGISVANTTISIISNPTLKYPLQSKRLGEEGTVVLRILVKRDGTLGGVVIKSSSGFERLDQAAIKAVNLYKFLPAIANGQPVDEWYQVPFVFKLSDVPKQGADQRSPS